MPQQNDQYDMAGAVQYHYGKFPPTNLDYERLLAPIRRAASALAHYDALLNGLHNKDLLLAPLRRQEAVISSRIEGTVATLDEVFTFEAAEEGDDGQPTAIRREVLEVHSYIRALNQAQSMMNNGLPICGRVIREAHQRMLFLDVRGSDKKRGTFKKEPNYIVDQRKKKVLFVPIEPNKLDTGFAKLETFLNDKDIDPLIQTALSHVEFEALHPFEDGNGRIGRMLITLNLWDKGLIEGPHFYISGHFEDQRDEYVERMRMVSSQDQWTEWCIFFMNSLERQANENTKIAREIVNLYEEMKEVFRSILSSQWSIIALDYVFEKPIFRNSLFTSSSGIPKQTAGRITKTLSDHGLLTVILPAAGRRSAFYAFEPLLEIVRH